MFLIDHYLKGEPAESGAEPFPCPHTRFDSHEATFMIERYSAFEDLLNADSAKGVVNSPLTTPPRSASPQPLILPSKERARPGSQFISGPKPPLSAAGASEQEKPLYRGHRIAVVVPAYNEELLIEETLTNVPDFVEKIYVIDDCSRDATWKNIRKAAIRDPRIVSIRHDVNRGVGASIVTGYKAALADGMGIAAVMAGDNQMDPEVLPDLLDPIIDGKCDYAVGNRLLSPEYRKGMSTWRFVGNAVLTLLTKIASGYWQMMDPQNGYTAISARALERIGLDHIYPRYGYCNDLMVRLNVCGFRMCNIPHPAKYGREKSGIKYSSYIFKVSRLLLRDFLWRLKMKYVVLSFHPLVFYYIMGAGLTIVSLFGGAYSLYYKFVLGHPIFIPAIASMILFGIGGQFILFAMMFDMQQEKNGGSGGWYL
jgi:glycosyltransferase involved in cell wall biosynthesis